MQKDTPLNPESKAAPFDSFYKTIWHRVARAVRATAEISTFSHARTVRIAV